MNIFSLAWKSFRRDLRSGELKLILASVVVAVASLTSVNFFTDRVRVATEQQATELLAADLVLRSRNPIPTEIRESARAKGLRTVNIVELRSIVLAGDKLHMAEVKAVEPGYPLRGQLRITDSLFTEEKTTTAIPEPGTVWLDNRLFQLLDVDPGSSIRLGEAELTVGSILSYEPDRGGDMFNIAPRLMMNMADLAKTGLILPASRVDYNLLLAGERQTVETFRREVVNTPGLRIHGIRESRPELRSALERAEQFLGLASLVSIALAGLAIAMSAHRFAIRHFDHCAILRCHGAEQNTITRIYLLQLLILSVTGSLLGCAIGYFAQEIIADMLAGLIGAELPGVSLTPFFLGLAAGIVTVIGFAMPQILRIATVSPLRVLRRDLEPLPPGGISSYGIAIVALALLTPWQAGNIRLTAYAFLGILLTAGILTVCSLLLVRYLNKQRHRVGIAFRFGLANVARRSRQSIAQILGIGLGITVMLLLTLVRTDLLDNWRDSLPEGTPNYFLINIQAKDIPELESFLQNDGKTIAELYPMVRARLTAINGRPVDPQNYSNDEARRWVNREYNLSWADDLPEANRLVKGKWWTDQATDRKLFSISDEMQKALELNPDDTLTYLIAGREVTGTIANVRQVDWDSFNANFFVLANPGTLESYPASYITSFYLPGESRNLIIELVRKFPSITVFDLDALITQVRRIMEQVILAIEFVFGFTLLAGIIVLIAALQTTHDERRYESALLSTIGANKKQILSGLAAEFLCIGLIAGILSAFSATAIELILAQSVFNMDVTISYRLWVIAPLLCTVIIVLGGLAGTWRVLYTPPIVALREN